jgi:hypothetical protein
MVCVVLCMYMLYTLLVDDRIIVRYCSCELIRVDIPNNKKNTIQRAEGTSMWRCLISSRLHITPTDRDERKKKDSRKQNSCRKRFVGKLAVISSHLRTGLPSLGDMAYALLVEAFRAVSSTNEAQCLQLHTPSSVTEVARWNVAWRMRSLISSHPILVHFGSSQSVACSNKMSKPYVR